MRVWDIHLKEQPDLLTASFIDTDAVKTVSVVGAGGKTSLIFSLGQAFGALGKRVIITTTTHMFNPEYQLQTGEAVPFPFIRGGTPESVLEAFKTSQGVIVGEVLETNPHRIKGFSPQRLDALRPLSDVMLIEADGSRRLPCKAPGEHEPVIATDSDLVIAVLGLDSLGQPIREVCFRPELVSALLGKSMDERLTEADLVTLISHENGLRKNVTVPFLAVLNKADTHERREAAGRIGTLLAQSGHRAIITCFR